MKERFIAFVCGDIAVTGYIMFGGIISDFGLHAITTAVIGAIGGVFGMLGKEVIWPKLKKLFKIKNEKVS